jgi:hypothetical protein
MSAAAEDAGHAADDAGHAGWTLVQLSELIRRAEELLLDGITLVGPHAHAGMPMQATLRLDEWQVRRVVAALVEGVELAEQLELLASRLPAGPIEADYAAVRDAAANDLAEGVVDPRRARLVARLLDVVHGWPALAASLSGDVVSGWDGLTVEELLGSFRGADGEVVLQVMRRAGLRPGALFASCPPERLVALAAELRRVSGQPAS